MKKERNAANAFAKECIATALIKLMQEKSYEDITITEIAKKAGVSRVTYYRNYNSKDDIITHYLDELGYQLHQESKHLDPTRDTYLCIVAFFRYWIRHSEFLLCLYEAKLAYVLLEHINKSISIFSRDTRKKYEAYGILGSMHNIMLEWIRGGMKESPEEMAGIVSALYRVPGLPMPEGRN